MNKDRAKKGLQRILSAKQLLRVMSAQSVSTFSNQVMMFVIPWLILTRTGSALNAGIAAFVTGTVMVIGMIFGGVIVDRIGGRRASIAADVLSMVTVLVLPIALWFNFLPLWLIILTQSLGTLFDGPGMIAKDTLVPITAKLDKIPLIRATSLQESLQWTATFAGPLAAGLLIAVFSESITLLVVVAMFTICIALIAGVKRQKIVHDHPFTVRKAFVDMREGFAFLIKEPLLGPFTAIAIPLVAIFLPLNTVVLPAWFILSGEGAESLGIFLGVQALGSVVGGLGFAIISTKVNLHKWLVVTNFLYSVGYAAIIAFAPPGSALSVILSFLIGLTSAGWIPIMNTAYYTRAPERLFGRVSGAAWAAIFAGIPLVSLFYGWLVNSTSAATAIVFFVIANAVFTIPLWLVPGMKLIKDANRQTKRLE